jgi:hypothetical protein
MLRIESMMIDFTLSSSNLAKITRGAVFGLAGSAFFLACAPMPALAKNKPVAQSNENDSETKGDTKTSGRLAKAVGKDQKDAKSQNGSKNSKQAKSENGYGKSEQIGSFSDWGAYATPGKDKTCYAMSQPTDRLPKAKLKDIEAYVFVSMRPSEGVKNEVAINLGYPTKENSSASASVDEQEYELITKGTNAWLKNAAEEDKFVKAVKAGAKLVVKATSARGTATTDAYSLKGFSQAFDRAQKECR